MAGTLERIRGWYGGKVIHPPPDDGRGVLILRLPRVEYHWTAKVARAVVAFHRRNWQWL